MSKTKDISNLRFGKLTAIKDVGSAKYGRVWSCLCDCGKVVEVVLSALTSNNTKSCGCTKRKPKKNFIKGQSGFNILYSDYKKSAKTRKLKFKIPKWYFEILTKQNCFYCNSEPKLKISPRKKASYENKVFGTYTYNGIDRVDNSIGYISENVVTCCEICNRMKSGLTYNMFVKQCFNIKLNLGEKN